MTRRTVNGRVLELATGDITEQQVDVIGNAANAALRGGGGVDGAIHRAAGPGLLEELRRRYPHGTGTGTAVETSAHRLNASWVAHAVGPVWRGGSHGEADVLASAYRSVFDVCERLGARSVALPAISTGIYGYPARDAARVALTAARDHLAQARGLELIRFVLYSAESRSVFEEALGELGIAEEPTTSGADAERQDPEHRAPAPDHVPEGRS